MPPTAVDTRVDTLAQEISDTGHEREILRAQLAERDKTIAELRLPTRKPVGSTE